MHKISLKLVLYPSLGTQIVFICVSSTPSITAFSVS